MIFGLSKKSYAHIGSLQNWWTRNIEVDVWKIYTCSVWANTWEEFSPWIHPNHGSWRIFRMVTMRCNRIRLHSLMLPRECDVSGKGMYDRPCWAIRTTDKCWEPSSVRRVCMCVKRNGKSQILSTWLIIRVFAMPSLPDVSFLLNDFDPHFLRFASWIVSRSATKFFRVDC